MILRRKLCAVKIQSVVRRFLPRRILACAIAVAVTYQAMWRGHLIRLRFVKIRRATICLQDWSRRLLLKLRWWREKEQCEMAAEEAACRAVWELERQRQLEIEREEVRIQRLLQLTQESEVDYAYLYELTMC